MLLLPMRQPEWEADAEGMVTFCGALVEVDFKISKFSLYRQSGFASPKSSAIIPNFFS